MDISIIAIDRMLENSIKKGKTPVGVLKNKGKMLLSDARKMDAGIFVKYS